MQTYSEMNPSSRRPGRLTKPAGLALVVFAAIAMAGSADAQSQTFFQGKNAAPPPAVETCKGPVKLVMDATNESVLTTSAQFGTGPSGGQGGQFDPIPVLTIPNVILAKGQCINAHLSAIVGAPQAYGVSSLAMFQVALVPAAGGAPVAMEGHYATPYGIPSPAIATQAVSDVGMLAGNFFQTADGDLPPGAYNVNVYWAGAPGPGGAIGAAFTLKLYLY